MKNEFPGLCGVKGFNNSFSSVCVGTSDGAMWCCNVRVHRCCCCRLEKEQLVATSWRWEADYIRECVATVNDRVWTRSGVWRVETRSGLGDRAS